MRRSLEDLSRDREDAMNRQPISRDWRWAGIAALVLAAASPFAQGQTGSLSGLVTGPGGLVLPEATIRAVSTETGTDVRALSSLSSRYEIENIPEGTYTVSAAMPCCSFAPSTEEDVAIGTGQSVRFDIRLEETLNILADDPVLANSALRVRQQVPDDPVPRAADGRPDFTGIWFHTTDPLQDPPAALAWAEQLARERSGLGGSLDHPHNRCLPGQVYAPGAVAFMLKLVQTPDLLVILFEDVPGYRQVFLDGREHPPNPDPTWMGHSVGHWEGDTLVVETIGFNDRGWNWDNYPRTEQMRLEERFTRSTYGRIDVLVTIDDPGAFQRPWVRRMRLDFAPREELLEYVCENNKWNPDDEE